MNGAEEQEQQEPQQMIDVGVTPEEMHVVYVSLGHYVDGFAGLDDENTRNIGIAQDLQKSFLPALVATHPHYVDVPPVDEHKTTGGGPSGGFPVPTGEAKDGTEITS